MEPSLERLVVSILMMAGFVLAVRLLTARVRHSVSVRSGGGGIALSPGTPTLLYFWTKECAQCPPQERQIEEAVQKVGGRMEVRKINALEDEALARSMSVMTVPTTILFDARGDVTAWNAGLTTARKLISQIQGGVQDVYAGKNSAFDPIQS